VVLHGRFSGIVGPRPKGIVDEHPYALRWTVFGRALGTWVQDEAPAGTQKRALPMDPASPLAGLEGQGKSNAVSKEQRPVRTGRFGGQSTGLTIRYATGEK